MQQNSSFFDYIKNNLFTLPRVKAFIHTILHSCFALCIFLIYLVLCYAFGKTTVNTVSHSNPILALGLYAKYGIFLLVSGIILYAIFSNAFVDFIHRKSFEVIGFHNHANEHPVYMWRTRNGCVQKLHFYSHGIPDERWNSSIPALENALNISIGSIHQEKRAKDICVTCCKGKYDYNRSIFWHNNALEKDAVLIVGECMYTPIKINYSVDAHILIGGSTGSGKTWLLKHLLLQCINKNYHVVIADFKGGIDFPRIWHDRCDFLTEEDDVIKSLNDLNSELIDRTLAFLDIGVDSIEKYNKATHKDIPRYIFACDELAELLDCTGLPKEEKEKKKEIISLISRIARKGRAYGIHLILSTQRPDADIVPGQIKNNITYRICGKADDTLSRIILDNSLANDRIPSDSVGVFLDNHGNLFKGYTFDEQNII